MAHRRYTFASMCFMVTIVLAASPGSTPLLNLDAGGPPAALHALAERAPPPRSPLPFTEPDWSWFGFENIPPQRNPDYDLWLSDPHWWDVRGYDAVDQLRIDRLPRVKDQVEEMLKLYSKMPHRGTDLLYKAVQMESPVVMRALLAKGVKPHPSEEVDIHRYRGSGETPIHEAVYRGCMDCLSILVDEAGVHPDAAVRVRGKLVTPLVHAVEQGHCKVVEWLLDTGRVNPARMHWPGNTEDLLAGSNARSPLLIMTPEAMGWAAQSGDRAVLRLLLVWAKFDQNIPLVRRTPANRTWLTTQQLSCVKEGFRQAASHGGRHSILALFMFYLSYHADQPLVQWNEPSDPFMQSLASSVEKAVIMDDVLTFRLLTLAMYSLPSSQDVVCNPERQCLQQLQCYIMRRGVPDAVFQAIHHNSPEVFVELVKRWRADMNALYPNLDQLRAVLLASDVLAKAPRGVISRYLGCFTRDKQTTEHCNERLNAMPWGSRRS